jgi:alkaline phosphatase
MKSNANKALSFTLILILINLSIACTNEANLPEKKVRNIILFIGDGMGTAQVYGGMTVSSSKLILESFPYSGFSKTYSANKYVTDSGAGGTAIACGLKTNNGMIGMGPDSTIATSILEIAHNNGLATGVISTSAITHATPASFVAHNINRSNYEEIAADFLKGTVNVFMGGGKNHFTKRADSTDLTINLKEQGYDVVYNIADLKISGSSKMAALLADEHMPPVKEGREGMLKEMTRKAIEILSRDEDGFFLMVEGSMIDWGAHAGDLPYTVSEVIDMDEAVGIAKDFANKNGETLIVVTADHETGGLTILDGDLQNHTLDGAFQTGDHTGIMVPIFSYGPDAQRFSGIHENTFFLNEFLSLLNLNK